MTITVTDLEEGPIVATGAKQTVAYSFMTLDRSEIEVSYVDAAGVLQVLTSGYSVMPNKALDRSAVEGGEVVINAGVVPAGRDVWLKARPAMTRHGRWANAGSRLSALNDEQDRDTLRALLLAKQAGRAEVLAEQAAVEAASASAAAAEALAAVGGIAFRVGSIADLAGLSSVMGVAIVAGREDAGDGGGGVFVWVAGDVSADVSADPLRGVWVARDGASGSNGAWRRTYDGRPQVRWWGRNGAAINACIRYCAAIGGGEYDLEPITYITTETVEPRRGTVGYGVRGKTVIKLANAANVDVVRTYRWQDMYDGEIGEVTADPDLTLDCGFRGVVIHGNRLNQTASGLLFGWKHYGRRPVIEDCIITDIAGIGLLTAKRGTHTTYDFEDTNAPASVGELEIMNCDDEHWVNDGLNDIHFKSIITNVCGDRGTLPRMSRYLSGERVNSVFVKGYGAQVATIACDHMNLNGAVSGKLFVAAEQSRLDIDTLICAGGEGCFEFRSGCRGLIKALHPQANVRKYGALPEPYILNQSSAMTFGTVYIRRGDGDNAAHGIVDTGGGSWGDVIPVQGTNHAGSLFVAAGQNISIKRLKAAANNLNDCDGNPSAGLVTRAGCQMLTVGCDFNSVAGTVWRNEQANTRAMGTFTGVLAAGGVFDSGVTGSPGIERNSLKMLRVDYRDAAGSHKVSQARFASASFDTLSVGAKTVTINHNLWRTPAQEDIQSTLRIGGFTTPPVISGCWLSSFNSTSVTFRVTVAEAATGAGVIAHVNVAIG